MLYEVITVVVNDNKVEAPTLTLLKEDFADGYVIIKNVITSYSIHYTKLYELVGIRYPRGTDNSQYDKSNISIEYTHLNDNSDVLLVTYGRIFV